LVDQAGEFGKDCRGESGVLGGVAVADVVYADEDCEEGVV